MKLRSWNRHFEWVCYVLRNTLIVSPLQNPWRIVDLEGFLFLEFKHISCEYREKEDGKKIGGKKMGVGFGSLAGGSSGKAGTDKPKFPLFIFLPPIFLPKKWEMRWD